MNDLYEATDRLRALDKATEKFREQFSGYEVDRLRNMFFDIMGEVTQGGHHPLASANLCLVDSLLTGLMNFYEEVKK